MEILFFVLLVIWIISTITLCITECKQATENKKRFLSILVEQETMQRRIARMERKIDKRKKNNE